MLLAIFLHFAYVYNEIFTCPNGIFTHLGWVDIDFFSTSGLVPRGGGGGGTHYILGNR